MGIKHGSLAPREVKLKVRLTSAEVAPLADGRERHRVSWRQLPPHRPAQPPLRGHTTNRIRPNLGDTQARGPNFCKESWAGTSPTWWWRNWVPAWLVAGVLGLFRGVECGCALVPCQGLALLLPLHSPSIQPATSAHRSDTHTHTQAGHVIPV